MHIWNLIIIGLLVAVLAAHLVSSGLFVRSANRKALLLEAGPATGTAHLPDTVRAFAVAAGGGEGGPARAVRLEQECALELKPGAAAAEAHAMQTFSLGEPGFVWLAEVPFLPLLPKFRAVDALVHGQGRLSVRVAGSIPVVNASGPETARAQAMRYLAELPWIPDAILGNPSIDWSEEADGWVSATLPISPLPATVRFRFEGGEIVEMMAKDRPAETAADGTVKLRDWRGLYSDYAEVGGRRIPRRGEVGYIRDGTYAPYWWGRVTGYQILR